MIVNVDENGCEVKEKEQLWVRWYESITGESIPDYNKDDYKSEEVNNKPKQISN